MNSIEWITVLANHFQGMTVLDWLIALGAGIFGGAIAEWIFRPKRRKEKNSAASKR
ncbi:MAG: hypothetical protein LBV02_07900 [Bacteroidales bacterium]|jgi:cbb3-type cytochrome oxidase subunit 3|nr:hypothetical protein [Bacteroidales bacterium]